MEEDHSRHSLLPNWVEAQRHASAVSTGRPILTEYQYPSENDHPVCQCCNNLIDREEANMCANKKGLSYLGFGVPLYFLFIKYCIILNLLLIVTDGIVSVYKASSTNTQLCQQYFKTHPQIANSFLQLRTGANTTTQGISADNMKIICASQYIMIANIEKGNSTTEIFTRVSSFIIHIVFLIYIKISLHQTGQYYNEVEIVLADYAVLFKCLPKNAMRKR